MVPGRYKTEFAKLEPSCTTSEIIRDPRLIRRPAARVSQEPPHLLWKTAGKPQANNIVLLVPPQCNVQIWQTF